MDLTKLVSFYLELYLILYEFYKILDNILKLSSLYCVMERATCSDLNAVQDEGEGTKICVCGSWAIGLEFGGGYVS